MKKKAFNPKDMAKIRYLSGVTLSPDGRLAAYTVSQGDPVTGLFHGKLRVVETESGRELPFDEDGNSPAFLNNGTLAFLSARNGEPQVFFADLVGGMPRQITSMRHGVHRFVAAPDCGRIAFDGELWPEEIEGGLSFQEMDVDERAAWLAELDMRPYEITDLGYKDDTWFGMRKGQKLCCAIVDLSSGRQELLPCGDMESFSPALSQDGERAAFYGFPHTGIHARQPELFCLELADSTLTQVSCDLAFSTDVPPIFTLDGRSILLSADVEDVEGWLTAPCIVSLEEGTKTYLTADTDLAVCHGIHPPATNRTAYGEEPPYLVLVGETLYFLSSFHGRESIFQRSLSGKGGTVLVRAGETAIHSFAVDRTGRIAYLMGRPERPAELFFEGRQLTDCNRWLTQYDPLQVEELWIPSKDGQVQIQTWLVHPIGQEPGQLYPAVLYVRGGPTLTYNEDYWHEFHAIASQGIAVVYANPRGSLGYGPEFSKGVYAWGEAAKEDLLAALDGCVKRGFIDPKRVGICGGSYGGYMTNRMITETDRFAAAVSQRSMFNPVTFYGCADGGYISSRHDPSGVQMLKYLNEKLEGAFVCSIDGVRTPLLILHGYRDQCCSFEQAEQLFTAMRERNPKTPVRLVMFPEENHEINRKGKLYNQIRHLDELVDWLKKYLVEGGEPCD